MKTAILFCLVATFFVVGFAQETEPEAEAQDVQPLKSSEKVRNYLKAYLGEDGEENREAFSLDDDNTGLVDRVIENLKKMIEEETDEEYKELIKKHLGFFEDLKKRME